MEWSDEDRRQMYARGLAIRGVAAGAFLTFFSVTWLAGLRPEIPGLPYLIGILVALVAVNPLMWMVGQRRSFVLVDFRWHWALDIIAVSGIIYFFGLLDIPLSVSAFMIMIVSSATFGSQRTSFWLAHWSSVALVALVFLEEVRWVPHQHLGFADDLSFEGKAITAGGSILLFYLFGYLAGSVASQLRGKAEQVEQQRQEVEAAYLKEQMARDRMVLLSALVQHDIYSPLGAISGACRLATESCEEGNVSEVTRFVRMIDDRLRSIEAAVATLGVFSSDSGEVGEFALRDVVDGLVEDVRSESEGRHVSVEIEGMWPMVRLPREEVYHVLRNLVINAVKAVDDEGSGRVSVESVRASADGTCKVQVIDNGFGVSDDLTALLNQPSLRKLGARKPTGGFGAGLGLSSNVARGWGGGVEYQSRGKGEGAIFQVILPASVVRWDP